MRISEIMSENVETIPPNASVVDAASRMEMLDCGVLPIGDDASDKLKGVITDRDIVIRCISKGLDPASTTVEQIKSDRVLYCFEDDALESAAESMHDQQVSRLIVLNNPQEKRMRGIVSLGDISRSGYGRVKEVVGYATEGVKEMAH